MGFIQATAWFAKMQKLQKNLRRKGQGLMKKNKEPEKSSNTENWIGVGVALGALVFVLTHEPVWIAVGVALGAALDWKKPKNQE